MIARLRYAKALGVRHVPASLSRYRQAGGKRCEDASHSKSASREMMRANVNNDLT